jgi:hypothetical protein
MRGSVMWWRSGSTRITPVLNRTERAERCLDLNRGKPITAPARSPAREALQLPSARANASSPKL